MKQVSHLGTLRQVVSTRMPTKRGAFEVIGFERDASNGGRRVDTALAIVRGDLIESPPPLLRVHSQCFTGEVLGSLRCDCGDQFEMAMCAIAAEGRGLVIYEYQEGRGIGLTAKLKAYELQDAGLDTIEANHALGFETDCRDFSCRRRSCAILGCSEFASSRTILTSVAPCSTPASRSTLCFAARLSQRRTRSLTSPPRKKRWATC